MRTIAVSRIENLEGQALVLANGELSKPVHCSGRDELSKLGETLEILRSRSFDYRAKLAARNRELWATTKDLRIALDDANLAVRAKGEFLATMSHEIRKRGEVYRSGFGSHCELGGVRNRRTTRDLGEHRGHRDRHDR